jgi:hypothetical protein
MHEPLSQRLQAIIAQGGEETPLSFNTLLERTEGRGLYLVILLLCLPFVLPVSIPGTSTPFGLGIAWLALRFALGKPTRLHRKLGDRPLGPKTLHLLLSGGQKVLRFLEKFIKPRRTTWLGWRAVQQLNAGLLIAMALVLALPLPPIPPFTNALPAYAIILITISMMEEDGWMIWAGYAVALAAVLYFAFWAGLIVAVLHKYLEPVLRWLGLEG